MMYRYIDKQSDMMHGIALSKGLVYDHWGLTTC